MFFPSVFRVINVKANVEEYIYRFGTKYLLYHPVVSETRGGGT